MNRIVPGRLVIHTFFGLRFSVLMVWKAAQFLAFQILMTIMVLVFVDLGIPLLCYAFADKSQEPYGFVDKNGQVVINLRQLKLRAIGDRFVNGQCLVGRSDSPDGDRQRWFMNTRGRLLSLGESLDTTVLEQQLLEDRFEKSGQTFHEGLKAIANAQGSRIDYINSKRRVLSIKRFRVDKRFLRFNRFGSTYGSFIRIQDPIPFRGVFDCNSNNLDAAEGLIVFQQGDKFGYVDFSNSIVIPPEFDYCWPFSDGRALVYVETPLGGRFGYIDHTGKTVIPCKYAKAFPFSEGLAVVSDDIKSVEYKYIDRDGKTAFGKAFPQAKSFHDGLALVGRCYLNTDSF